ncbi:hypothetical protein MRB53_001789 [Persea americana]|uniref:Uncharacterized protein n=1 Tax=Persea americana TaxID=3435 RepID=A0ACC2MSW3_PERAE|nr:hypothetical protein MRB53_001789 [Persea americana]
MDTLLRTHNRLEFLHPLHGFAEKANFINSPKLQSLDFGCVPKKPLKKCSRNGCVKAKSSALLELVPEMKKENLEFELPMYDSSKPQVMDLVVVGGGPAGLAVAQQVSAAGLSVCSIDPSPRLLWPNNYGVWVDEFEAMDLLDCIDTTWSSAVVFINDCSEKYLDRPYGRVNRKQLKSKMMQKCISNGVQFHQAKVIKVIHEEFKSLLICNDGVTIQATVVLDATGFSRCLVQYDKPYNPGYQVAYGILAEVEEHPFELDNMVFMDWRDSHLNNNKELKERNGKIPTFLYAMPFSKNRIFLEETSLVARPGLAMEDIQERMEARLKHLGIKIKSIEEDERCVIPMGGPLPVLPQRVVGIGGTAGMVHPSTGYMVARTLAAAPIVADAIVCYLHSEQGNYGNELSAQVEAITCFTFTQHTKLGPAFMVRLEIMRQAGSETTATDKCSTSKPDQLCVPLSHLLWSSSSLYSGDLGHQESTEVPKKSGWRVTQIEIREICKVNRSQFQSKFLSF